MVHGRKGLIHMFVSEIYQDLKSAEVLGICDDATIFSRLTDAVRLIGTQGILDPTIGEMSLCVCDGFVTLPADVETVLGVNQGGQPTLIRDQWFQYHVNGSGTTRYAACQYTDVTGDYCTYRDPSNPVKLVAEVESPKDSNKPLRVFGWDDNGKRIFTTDANGDLADGFLVPTVYGFSQPNPTAPLIARIERIQKPVTNGFVRLIALNSDNTVHTQIGYYLPYETVPRYQRLRVHDRNWLKIKYLKKNFPILSVNDWINVENREALILAVKAVNARRKNAFDSAAQMESESSRLLALEAQSKRPPGIKPPQVIWNEGLPAGPGFGLFYD